MLASLSDLLIGPALARLCISAVFLYSALDKTRHWRESVAEVTELGLPFPILFAAATIATQGVGGLALATGLAAGTGAAMLGLFTISATFLGHRFWLLRGAPARREFTTALEHLAIVGGLLLVVLHQFRASPG